MWNKLSRRRRGPLILVDCGNYFLDNDNCGDRAVYQVTTRRLSELWPDAQVSWITLAPDVIRGTCGDARPFVLKGRHHWQLFNPGRRPLGRSRVARMFPRVLARRLRTRASTQARASPDLDDFLAAFRGADLVLAVGGGSFSDAFPEHACGILDTLEGAIAFGKPTALMSCGFERVEHEVLAAKARSVLPRVDLIGCREGVTAPTTLQSYGVALDRVTVTGDHAVELAYEARSDRTGDGIGISLRQAPYSGITDDHVETVASALCGVTRRHGAALVPLPVSVYGPSDMEAIDKVLKACGQPHQGLANLDTPQKLLNQLRNCRVAVTGSYHAAVFALSQGKPVVALAGSRHYEAKMHGLMNQFGTGCRVLEADRLDLSTELARTIEETWQTAESLRPRLLEAAQRQVEASRAAFRRLQTITDGC